MNDILYKVNIGTTVICFTLTMNTIIIVLCSCMVTTCILLCICTKAYKNSRSSGINVHKESDLVWPDPFLVRGDYCLQYTTQQCYFPLSYMLRSYVFICTELSSRPSIACSIIMLYTARYCFTLNFLVYNLSCKLSATYIIANNQWIVY